MDGASRNPVAPPLQDLRDDFPQCLFPPGFRLLPGLREIYELQLARIEYATLTKPQLIDQAAFFYSVDEEPTRHFLTCTGHTLKLPGHSSSRLKWFFANNPCNCSGTPQTA